MTGNGASGTGKPRTEGYKEDTELKPRWGSSLLQPGRPRSSAPAPGGGASGGHRGEAAAGGTLPGAGRGAWLARKFRATIALTPSGNTCFISIIIIKKSTDQPKNIMSPLMLSSWQSPRLSLFIILTFSFEITTDSQKAAKTCPAWSLA